MDVRGFASELLQALATVEAIERVALQSEGPVAKGRAHVTTELFLEFYFNEQTGTTAFALIRNQRRVWGIDRDNIRGWHLHPPENPMEHTRIEKLSVPEIVERLRAVLGDEAEETPGKTQFLL